MRDLRTLLDQAAGNPPDLPDLAAIRERGQSLKNMNRLGWGVAAAAAAVVVLAAGAAATLQDSHRETMPAPQPSQSQARPLVMNACPVQTTPPRGAIAYAKTRSDGTQAVHLMSPDGSGDREVGRLSARFRDLARVEWLSVKPVEGELARVGTLEAHAGLRALFAHLASIGVARPIAVGVGTDPKKSTENTVLVGQSGLTLPDRDYYPVDDARMTAVRMPCWSSASSGRSSVEMKRCGTTSGAMPRARRSAAVD
jgi:hypothetical protein